MSMIDALIPFAYSIAIVFIYINSQSISLAASG